MADIPSILTSPTAWAAYGAAAQASLVMAVRRPGKWEAALPPLAMAACLAAALPTATSGSPEAFQIGVGFGILFTSAITAGTAPARMSEGLLLAITTTFWLSFGPGALERIWWVPFAFVPTLVVAGLALLDAPTPGFLRVALYAWALAAMTALGIANFPRSDFAALAAQDRGWIVVLAATYLGAHVSMLAHNAFSIFFLLPIPMQDETFEHALARARAQARLLSANYAPQPLHPLLASAIVGGQAAFVLSLREWRPRGVGLGLHACLSLALCAAAYMGGPSTALDAPPERLPTGGDLKRAMRARRGAGVSRTKT